MMVHSNVPKYVGILVEDIYLLDILLGHSVLFHFSVRKCLLFRLNFVIVAGLIIEVIEARGMMECNTCYSWRCIVFIRLTLIICCLKLRNTRQLSLHVNGNNVNCSTMFISTNSV